MSTEGSHIQHPSSQPVAGANDMSGRGRGRSRGRGRGRGRGRSLFRQQSAGNAPANVVDQQLSQSPAAQTRQQEQYSTVPAFDDGHATAIGRSTGRSSVQQRQQQHPPQAHSLQEAGQFQNRQRAQGRFRRRESRYQLHASPAMPIGEATLPQTSSMDLPDCVICCEPMQVVSIGRCNHKSVCERCSLRLVMLYEDTRCPLCKAILDQVVMTQWKDPEPPDWSRYATNLRQLWHNPKWSRSIYVDDAVQSPTAQGKPPADHLHSRLQRIVARACSICDPQAQRPFPSTATLSKHVSTQHHRHMCSVCLKAQRSFPLELPLFASHKELQAHLTSAHSLCSFCNKHFFSAEDLWEHVHDNHFTCQLCLQHGAQRHFAAAEHLTEHLRREHFLCMEEECQDCFVAFDSLQQLQEHHRRFHSHSMPRWDPSRARHVPLSEIFPALGPVHDRPTGAAARRDRSGRRGQAQARPRTNRGGPSSAINGQSGPSAETQLQSAIQGEGQAAGPLRRLAPGHQQEPTEAFPDLAAAAPTSGSDQEAPLQQRHTRHARPLVKVTVKCPCGRRVSHQVIQEGQRPAALPCDGACIQAGRQQQLAGAFGVEDPSHHVPSFDRNRTPTYSPLLLTHAWSNKEWIQSIERQLAGFLSAKGSKRQSLPAMPRHQREVVHALAEQYGLASSSYKQEPGRYVELFKLPASSIPNKLLSETVRTMTHEDIVSLARAAHGHPMKLTDLRQDVDVAWFLKQWDGQYNTEWQSTSDVVVRFTTPQALKEALTALGGGIRGVFRVDRGWAAPGLLPQPSTSQAPPAKSAPVSSTPSSRHLSSSSQAAESSDWQTVKTSGSRAKGRGQSSASAGPRDTPAYASASPLDFQEPWRDEPESSGSSNQLPQVVGSREQRQRPRQAMMPEVAEDELPEDWEEAAAAADSAGEAGAEAVDGFAEDDVSTGSADGPLHDQVAPIDTPFRASSVDTTTQAEAASDDAQELAAADGGSVADNAIHATDEPASALSADSHSQAEAAALHLTGSAAAAASDADTHTAVLEKESADKRPGSVYGTAEQSDAHAGQADAAMTHDSDTHFAAPQSTAADKLSVSESSESALNESGANPEAHDEAQEDGQSGCEAPSDLHGRVSQA